MDSFFGGKEVIGVRIHTRACSEYMSRPNLQCTPQGYQSPGNW